MLPNSIGYYSLIFGLIVSLMIIFLSIKNFKNSLILDNKIKIFLTIQLILVFVSFFSLIVSFIISDFSNETVFNNSHTTKPLFYKITGTWGNHEGSLLLWLLVLTLFIFIFLIKTKNQLKNYRLLTVIFQQIIIFGFFIFLIKTSNPFNNIFPVPVEGLGLNPILQDPALAIHPPILYLGYVGTSIIFSSVLAATTLNYVDNNWAKHIKIWVLIAWIFLTFGILLGSIWAYYELGWGGFWFWDPVENVSLMPWLALTTLFHCILVLEKRSLFKNWVIILSIATFALSMSGTFLVRSGILNSVHTFANDPERGLFILSFLFILIIVSIFIFFVFSKPDNKSYTKLFFFSKETSIVINNWFMMYFLSVVLIGTVYPIFLDVISSQKISVGPPFYNKLLIPFLIPFLIFMAIGPKLKWIKSHLEDKQNLVVFFIVSVSLSFFIMRNFETSSLLNSILLISAFYLFFITIKDLFINKNYRLGQNMAHFGFSLLILSILFNSILSNEIVVNLKVGEKYKDKNIEIIFNDLTKENNKNYVSYKGIFLIKSNDFHGALNPELRIYNQPKIITSEADIKITLLKDNFITINSVQNEDYFNVRYLIKPFMLWIWISVLLISLGGTISLINKKNEK